MVKTFIERYVKLIAQYPDKVVVEVHDKNPDYKLLKIYAHNDDMSRIIGKHAHMIEAINGFIGAYSIRDRVTYKAYVRNIDDLDQ